MKKSNLLYQQKLEQENDSQHQMALVRKDQFWTLDLVMYTSDHPSPGLYIMKHMKDMKRYEMRSRSFVGVQIRNRCDNLESYLLRRFQLT